MSSENSTGMSLHNKALAERMKAWTPEVGPHEPFGLTDDGASLSQWLVKSWLTRCTEAPFVPEQPSERLEFNGRRNLTGLVEPVYDAIGRIIDWEVYF